MEEGSGSGLGKELEEKPGQGPGEVIEIRGKDRVWGGIWTSGQHRVLKELGSGSSLVKKLE